MSTVPVVNPPVTQVQLDPKLPIPINYAATAIPPASGVSGVGYFNGPWIEEGQRLQIGFWRMPYIQLSAVTLGLSSVREIGYTHMHSQLHCHIVADYYKVSSTEAYPVSGEVNQNQTFFWDTSPTDYQGYSYGTIDASTLGPMGRIYTKTPYYRRRLMTAAEIAGGTKQSLGLQTRSIEGANFLLGVNSCEWGVTNALQTTDLTFETASMSPDQRGSLIANWERWAVANSPIDKYVLPGGYSTSSENLPQIVGFIDSCGRAVQQCWVDRMPGVRPVASLPENYHSVDADGNGIQNDYFCGIPMYDPLKHLHPYTT